MSLTEYNKSIPQITIIQRCRTGVHWCPSTPNQAELLVGINTYMWTWLTAHTSNSKFKFYHTENKITCHNVAPPLKDNFRDYFKRRHRKLTQSNFQTALGRLWICPSLVFFAFILSETCFKTDRGSHFISKKQFWQLWEKMNKKSEPATSNFKGQVTPASSGSY